MVIYSASGVPVIAIDVDDSSYRYREIMGDCKVYLEFALTMHVEILPGSFIRHQGEVYTLMTYQDVTIRHSRAVSERERSSASSAWSIISAA